MSSLKQRAHDGTLRCCSSGIWWYKVKTRHRTCIILVSTVSKTPALTKESSSLLVQKNGCVPFKDNVLFVMSFRRWQVYFLSLQKHEKIVPRNNLGRPPKVVQKHNLGFLRAEPSKGCGRWVTKSFKHRVQWV